MKESDIRNNNIFQRYQNLVDIDARKFFYNKNKFKNINYKSWGCKEVRKIFVKKKFTYLQCTYTKTIIANPTPKPDKIKVDPISILC